MAHGSEALDAAAVSRHARWLASEDGGERLELDGAHVIGLKAVGWDLRLALLLLLLWSRGRLPSASLAADLANLDPWLERLPAWPELVHGLGGLLVRSESLLR